MKNIAVLGTGNMGAPMARNLAKSGFAVCAYDLVEAKVQALQADGVRACTSHAAAVAEADCVLCMLPSGAEVKAVFYQHLLGKCRADCILVDSSTIDLNDARAVHQRAAAAGYAMLDAPVSGGTQGAANAALSFMVGGDPQVLHAATPMLQAMGKTIIHCGAAGMGQAAKMCNNLMLGIQMVSVAEGFSLAQRVGLDAQKLFAVASASSGNCFALQTFCPVAGLVDTAPSSHDFKPGFSTALMLKDMQLALNAAQTAGLDLPLTPQAAALYQRFAAQGNGGVDFSGVIKVVEGGGDQ